MHIPCHRYLGRFSLVARRHQHKHQDQHQRDRSHTVSICTPAFRFRATYNGQTAAIALIEEGQPVSRGSEWSERVD